MANQDHIIQEKDFEIPEGWSQVEPPPGGGAPVPSVAVDRFASGAISTSTLGLQTDIAGSQMGGNVPAFRIQPPQPSSIAAGNAATQSIIEQTVSEAVAAATPTPYKPCIGVNYHTEQFYTVQLTDLNDLLSFNNAGGGVITLPGGPVGGFSFVQAVYGGGEGAGGTLAITNTPTNGMIAVVFTSPNVTLGTVSISDSNGNIWVPITTNSGNSEFMATFYCAKIAGGSNTVSVDVPFTPPTPPPDQIPFFTFIGLYEFSGMVPNGLDQFANGVGSGSSSISPTKSSTFAFTVAQATASSAGQNPTAGSGWTAVTAQPNGSWNYPAYLGSGLGGYFTGLGEYIVSPPVGVALSATATGGAVADCNFTIANFQVAPNTAATGFTSCFYTYIENTGTGTYILESAAQIDGANQSVKIGPNEGLLVCYDGTNWATMRGIGGAGGGGVTSLDGLTGPIILAPGTGITISDSPGTITISATAVAENAQTIWSYPVATSASAASANPVSGSIMNFVANQVNFFYISIDKPIQVGNFTFLPTTGDATHHYDWGMYDLLGNLIWNLGATIFSAGSSSTQTTTPLAQGTITIQPGNYWLAFTGNGTGLTWQAATSTQLGNALFFANSKTSPAWWTSVTSSTGGTLTGLGPTVPSAPTTATNLTNGSVSSFSGQGIIPLISLST
jgi:hypothetical protein